MEIYGKEAIAAEINRLGISDTPFLFVIDYEGVKGAVVPLSEIDKSEISCNINSLSLGRDVVSCNRVFDFKPEPISIETYGAGFDNVLKNINAGNSYLLNLTYKTCLGTDIDMNAIYASSTALYRFLWRGRFVFFSPEPFIKTKGNRIYSFPMKGTIDSSLPDAEERLLNDYKEICEHNTIVDLIRNDLSVMCTDVRVDKFRYIEEVKTSRTTLLQTSSQISGALPIGWRENIGDLIYSMLPAGSICGAPKAKTLQIIKESENSPRGYYTGIMGVFDGEIIDSCVIIRYIEKCGDGKFYYRSGGGITSRSSKIDEYNEMISKVYV